MNNLRIDFEWDSPQGARGPELRATWAQLLIRAGDELVTRLEDLGSHDVRPGVYGPLYPVAEWIVKNWWSLLHEVYCPKRASEREYEQRHNLAAAAEGFALPDLQCRPEGQRTQLQWRRRRLDLYGVQFINDGYCFVPTRQLESELRAFIDAVVTRLEDKGVHGTFLAEEWAAINASDAEERQYCMALGRLGLDPYVPESEAAGRILVRLAEFMPETLLEEFLATASSRDLGRQSSELTCFLSAAREFDLDVSALRDLKSEIQGLKTQLHAAQHPWSQGYALARELRRLLNGFATPPVADVASLGNLLGVQPSVWEKTVCSTKGLSAFLSAAVGIMRDSSPYFAVKPVRNDSGKVFLLCRALYEYLAASETCAAIVTEAYSEQQKRNRAFAAEFIAPSAQLRERMAGDVVTPEEIEDLAVHFRTSEYVIRHQIVNHELARIHSE